MYMDSGRLGKKGHPHNDFKKVNVDVVIPNETRISDRFSLSLVSTHLQVVWKWEAEWLIGNIYVLQ